MINRYVICYDISNNTLRTKLEKLLKNYGIRIQYSIFECKLKPIVFKELKVKLQLLVKYEKFIDETDSIIVFNICNGCYEKAKVFGKNKLHKEKYLIV